MAKETRANDSQQLQKRRQAWSLRTAHGWTQTRIGREMGVHQATISRYLKAAHEQYLEAHQDEVAEVKVRQSLLLDQIVEEAMDAWYASRGLTRTVLESGVEIEQVSDDAPLGKPLYLRVALEAMAEQRKIWGANAVVGLDVTSAGRPIPLITEIVVKLPDEPVDS